jgi:hypothetical protein
VYPIKAAKLDRQGKPQITRKSVQYVIGCRSPQHKRIGIIGMIKLVEFSYQRVPVSHLRFNSLTGIAVAATEEDECNSDCAQVPREHSFRANVQH